MPMSLSVACSFVDRSELQALNLPVLHVLVSRGFWVKGTLLCPGC